MSKVWHNILAAVITSLASIALYVGTAQAMPSHPTTLKHWTVSHTTEGNVHRSCTAERQITPGVFVSVMKEAFGNVLTVTLQGVNFEHGSDYGLWSIDGGDPVDIFVTAQSAWNYQFLIDAKPSGKSLSQFRDGAKLNVLLGEKKYVLDLTETAAMLKSLKDCNERGQRDINRERMRTAALATTRA